MDHGGPYFCFSHISTINHDDEIDFLIILFPKSTYIPFDSQTSYWNTINSIKNKATLKIYFCLINIVNELCYFYYIKRLLYLDSSLFIFNVAVSPKDF